MTDKQWQEVWRLYRQAQDLSEEDRRAFLASMTSSDPEVRDEVVQMLDEPRDAWSSEPTSRVGTRFGRYEIAEMLGSGGMGYVFSAHDTELGRKVAIKFLTPELAASRPAIERLMREAKAASALNHPHIITVYEVIRSAGDVGIAMEHIEGKSLRCFCDEPQKIADVVRWGGQIARALAAAKQGNIVHRDIKPENLMMREDGILKVLDFGLARSLGIDRETLSLQTGTNLAGTLSYMAPEQTRSEPATSASDVFCFGLVLYELATGKHPFRGASAIDTAYAVAHTAPKRPSSVNRAVPIELDELLLHMLEKNPDKRPTAFEVDERLSAVPVAGTSVTGQRSRNALALLLLCVITAVAVWLFRPRVLASGGTTPILTTPLTGASKPLRIVPFTTLDGSETDPAFSPDGRFIAFTWTKDRRSGIYVKPVGSGVMRQLTKDAGPDTNAAWSPDGRRIAFLRGQPTGKVAVITAGAEGGDEQTAGFIEDTAGYPGPIAWMADGKSLVVRDGTEKGPALFLLTLASGQRSLLAVPVGGRFAPSPDGNQLAFERPATSEHAKICLLTFSTHAENCLIEALTDTQMAWLPDGRNLLLTNLLGLWRVSTHDGSATKLSDSKFDGLTSDRQGQHLAFWRRYSDLNVWRAKTDGSSVAKLIASSGEDSEPEYSPDGRKILFRSTRSGNYEIWVCASDGTNAEQLTALGGHLGSGRWSPDGSQIVFDATPPNEKNVGVWAVPASGGAARRLTPADRQGSVPSWSRDGRWVYFAESSSDWKVPVNGGRIERLTIGDDLDLTESVDGRYFYFRKSRAIPGIFRRPVAGGEAALVPGTETVFSRYWQLLSGGIYFMAASNDASSLQHLDLATNRVSRMAKLGSGLVIGPRGLAISPDGRWILFTREDLSFSDIMLVSGF